MTTALPLKIMRANKQEGSEGESLRPRDIFQYHGEKEAE